MTDNTQPEAGSTYIIRLALELGLLWIDGDGRDKVREALDALDTLEAQLEAIGAGGVSGPLMGIAAPPTAQAEGWTKASKQLPPCREDQLYIGINTAGFAGVFNAVRVVNGNTYCLMEVAEESVSIMSDLAIWKPFNPPTSAEGVEHG